MSSKPKILLGITGSVATIKLLELNELICSWAELKIIATDAALNFISKEMIELNIVTNQDEWTTWSQKGDNVLHIDFRNWADLFCIAPLSANTLAKLANGLSDNLLTCIARAWDFKKPIYLCPAMNTHMWEHPITTIQLNILKDWGYYIINPIKKELACGDVGMGAMENPMDINNTLKSILNLD